MALFLLNTGRIAVAVGKKAIKKILEKGAKRLNAAEKKKFLGSGDSSKSWGPGKGSRGEAIHVDKPVKGPVLRPGERFDSWNQRFKKNKGGLMIKPKLAKRGW